MKTVNIHKQTKNQDQIHSDDFVWRVAMAPVSPEKQALRLKLDWWGKAISARVVMTKEGEYVGAVSVGNNIALITKLNNLEVLALNNVIELPAEDGKRPWQMIYRALQLTA